MSISEKKLSKAIDNVKKENVKEMINILSGKMLSHEERVEFVNKYFDNEEDRKAVMWGFQWLGQKDIKYILMLNK